jgi:hypothetical protein
MPRADLFQLPPHERMTPGECLEYCARNAADLKEVVVIAFDHDDELVIRSSGMTRRDALWLLTAGVDHAKEGDYGG